MSQPLSPDWIIDLRLNGVNRLAVARESFEVIASHDAFIRVNRIEGSIFGVRVMVDEVPAK